MKISLGADHGGLQLREAVLKHLKEKGYDVRDHGTHSKDSVDYPDYAQLVAKDVSSGEYQYGVLICTSGIGMSITANKTQGARAALITQEDMALYARMHNNANIICMGEKYTTSYMAKKLLDIFLNTDFEGGRHARRVEKMEN